MEYKTPGVYIEEVSLLPPSVVGVETSIPAFIGHTQRAARTDGTPIIEPLRITSLREYEANFGTAEPEDDMEVAVKVFLDRGGQEVDSVVKGGFKQGGKATELNMYYAVQHYFMNGGGPCYIISIGLMKSPDPSKLIDGLDMLAKEDEPTLIVIPESIYASNYFDLINRALTQCNELGDRFTIIDVQQGTSDVATIDDDINKVFRKDQGGLVVDNLKYGAAYYPYLETTIDFNISGKEGDIKVKITKIKDDGNPQENGESEVTLESLKSTQNLLYNRCVNALKDVTLTLPPSAAIAGVYARVDAERGVWKAPANVGIQGITGAARKITDADQRSMNVDANSGKSVNAIRVISGRGTVVWGARTLDGNSNEWRYVNVRRFFNFVEESVKKATYRFVFEPNDANTWVKVRAMIENFLTLQWRAGALMGTKPEQAFFVRVGLGQTMTPLDVLEGRLIVEIGMAVVRPAEFIILRFMHKLPEA